MSAEKSYNPFSGFSKNNGNKPEGAALGSKLHAVDWETTKLVPGQWNVFDAKSAQAAAVAKSEKAAVSKVPKLSDEEVAEWRKEQNITLFSDTCPHPLTKYEMCTMVPQSIHKKFTEQGFSAPTAIQAQSWPILFENRDIVGIAKTGSGKTLAFVVPAILHIAAQSPLRPGDGPISLVMAPTRELAQQIEAEARKVLPTTMRVACIYGGTPKGPQVQMLREGVHILVCTPGRLIDMMEINRVNLLRVTFLILDEADRMLDMGFEPQVRQICSQIRPDRQTCMFSATWPKEIQALASTFQRNFIRIHVGSTELVANPDVTQRFVLTQEFGKFDELKKVMALHKGKRVLVFCKTKRTADQLEYQLKGLGYDAMAIHGDKEQRQREFILERFRRDPRLCVVATDVAARGLDIKQLEVVVNYDFPMQIDDYVHRIGRTGRAGAKGESITFITKKEDQVTAPVVHTLIGIIEGAKQEVPEWMREWGAQGARYNVVRRQGYGGFDRRGPQLHYNHGNRPSFDASSGTANAQPKAFFGLPAQSSAPQQQQQPKKEERSYVRFDSDDEDAKPAKKSRTE
ncbi:ATP-dependent DEAD/DEAH box RNA helicase, putative [Bodo saltans]|uniref:RNA helicase n=1 Tax=Bodo saltans TaxID=75058 RepID=A0A0S4JT14_BODSA|nr:ATP-dependent DEAD/DEAH box RNA helicase, putative [Bodo saltans]|eukprot:CUG93502.1 ATP-dependent DEAD/DEAH box RNA helicase, putative [Bodo saltans]